MALRRTIGCLLGVVALWLGSVLLSVAPAAVDDEAAAIVQLRTVLCDRFRQSALAGARKQIEANHFLSREKKAIFVRFSERLFNETQVIPVMVDTLVATYGSKLLGTASQELQAQMINQVGTIYGKIGAAGLTYLSDRERRLVLSQQMEVMGRLAPQDCVLYANAQVTLDSIAKNATATGAFLQTMSNQEVQAILDAQLNTMSLGALHKAKPRRMTSAQYEEMQKLTGEAIVDWMLSFAPEDQERFAQFLWGDASKLSADDVCAINISLNQMALEAEGNTGELVRLAMMLGFFEEDELISD